jgi:hypothetical protein
MLLRIIVAPHFLTHTSSVGITLGYGLDDRGSRVRFPAWAGNSSLHHRSQNGSGVHPASHPMGTRGSFPGGKATGAWSWPLTSTYCRGQRMSGAIPPLPITPSWGGAQLKHRNNFTFTFTGLTLFIKWSVFAWMIRGVWISFQWRNASIRWQ